MRIKLIFKNCERCGKQMASTNKSLLGISEAIRNKYTNICSKCANEEEQMEILKMQGSQIVSKVKQGQIN